MNSIPRLAIFLIIFPLAQILTGDIDPNLAMHPNGGVPLMAPDDDRHLPPTTVTNVNR